MGSQVICVMDGGTEIRVSEEDLLCDCQPEDLAFVRPIHTVAACKRWHAGGEFEPWQPKGD